MYEFEAQQGSWKADGEVLTGLLKSFPRAFCLYGNEEDTEYTVEATLKLVAGAKASVLAFYNRAEDLTTRFIECVLDVANQRVQVDLVIGSLRKNVASAEYTLILGTEYKVKVHVKKETDDSGTVVFLVDGVSPFPAIEDLASSFLAGLWGFALEGSLPTNSVVVSEICYYPATASGAYSTIADVRGILDLKDDHSYDTEIGECIATADGMVDGQLKAEGLSVASPVPQLIKDASKFLAAWSFRRKRDPAGAEAFWVEGQRFLQNHIDGNPSADSLDFRAVSD